VGAQKLSVDYIDLFILWDLLDIKRQK